MRPRLLVTAVVLVAAAGAAAACGSQSAQTKQQRLPEGFVGMTVGGPVLSSEQMLDKQLDSMVASGVESLRVEINWAAVQPYPSLAEVPAAQRSQFQAVSGVPTRFGQLDRIVGAAAARGLSVLPVVVYAPTWDALQPGTPASPPKSPAPFAAFLRGLVQRYGPGGAFWSAHPSVARRPIRMWQIWNEPNFPTYWSVRPFAPSYVRLLGAARAALNGADPGAKLVLAGLPDFSWEYLAQIYQVPGARRLFDIVAIHPYTAHASGVVVILQRVRAVMDRFGDRAKPILATELSWPSSQGKAPPQFGLGTTEANQAAQLGQAIPLLAADRGTLGLEGFYWYTWMTDETPRPGVTAFDFAGLLKVVHGEILAKPAYPVFKRQALAAEGCASKGKLASDCL